MLYRIAHRDCDTSLGRHALTLAICIAFWLIAINLLARWFS